MTNNQLTREENVQAVFDLKAGYTLGLADVEILKRVARMALAAMDSEPVAEVCEDYAIRYISSGPAPKEGLHPGDKLYRHAQHPVVPDGGVTAEHRRVIEMLLNVCGAAFELADDSCQQDVDGEDCHVVPDDAFQKLSDALDEIENTLPTEDIDRPDVFLAWSAIPKAALKSLLQAGNSPVTGIDLASGPDRTVEVRYVAPPGYVMVPKEPTEAMMLHNSGCQHHAWDDPDCAMRQTRRLIWSHMLAAVPQEVKP